MPVKKETQYHAWYWVAVVLAMLAIQAVFAAYTQIQTIPYSEFQDDLKAGKIAEVRVSGNYIQGKFKEPNPKGYTEFITTRVDAPTAKELWKKNVKFAGAIESTLLRDLLSWLIPIGLFFGVWWFMYRRFAGQQGFGGLMSVGRSKAKVYVETDTKTTFADVAGVDEAKAELQEIVAFLKDPERYGRLGGRVPKGVLLVGPPGTGKTLLARAVAGEANVPFFSINGSEFVEMFVGVGAARVRDLFEQAHAKAPCIIFIDELDALGRARGAYPGAGGHDEKEQTLNQLLPELDGFDTRAGMILLAATNRPEILDPALLRAGRFDRQVLVDRPDKQGRVQILKVHVKKVSLAPDADLEKIAGLTAGFTGADLANLVNEATLVATRRGADAVSLADFTAAVERIVAGLEKKRRILSPKEREIVAHHEMGHALVALALPGTDPVHKVSIIPRGIGALGYTIQRPTEDRFLQTSEELENKMAVLLGGRAAEHVIYGRLSTGAADDLVKATDIARSMVTRYGMEEKLGNLSYQDPPSPSLPTVQPPPARQYSEETARAIDRSVRAISDATFERAVSILTANRAVLEDGARQLLQKETLTEDEIGTIAVTLKRAA